MASLRATFGIKNKEEEVLVTEEEESEEGRRRDGGMKLRSVQACMQARSKVRPLGTSMTGSYIKEDEIGHMKLNGGAGAEASAPPFPFSIEEEESLVRTEEERLKENFQRDLLATIRSRGINC